MNPAPALAVVVLELGPVVDRLERERIAEEELERAEDERFELAGTEAMVGTELAPDPPDRPGVAEQAIVGPEGFPHEPVVRDLQGGRHAVEGRSMPFGPRQGD